MGRILVRLLFACLLAACAAGCARPRTQCVNPLTYTDIPDNDVIRVGDDYYMVSTTMYFCPGAPVMHSRDLVHWRIVDYIYDYLEGTLSNVNLMFSVGLSVANADERPRMYAH